MALIDASNVSKVYGDLQVFSGISLSLPRRASVALVGPNGIGKTTLLQILTGREEPSTGVVHRAKNLRIGYLPQGVIFTQSTTLWDTCLETFAGLKEIESEIHALESSMSQSQAGEELMTRYGSLLEMFEGLGGYFYEVRMKQVLEGLGFDKQEYQRPLNQLSGGQRTRAQIARILLEDPDIMILDEPTNHLDIAAVEWLEDYLSSWTGSVLMVSHDRFFLDRVVNGIMELRQEGLETFNGNYSAYLTQREERWERREQVFQTEIDRLMKELDYIKRHIAGQRTLQAKGKLKRISRQVEAIEKLGVSAVCGRKWSEITAEIKVSGRPMGVEEVERRIKAIPPPGRKSPRLHLSMAARNRSGNIVLRASDLEIGYSGNGLFRIPKLELKRLDCVMVIGPNGSGKTTFLKTILGELEPLNGKLQLGASLNVGYFAQGHEDLDQEKTLMEEIECAAPQMLPGEIRSYLGKYMFSGDDVFKPVGVLSGGERGRLSLAKLALTHANILLLDEPTNHLDIPSQEILQSVLGEFGGTILLVTHDRYLMDALATIILEIDPESRTMNVYPGNFSAYKQAKETQRTRIEDASKPEQQITIKEKRNTLRGTARSKNELRRQKEKITQIETQVAEMEVQLQAITKQMETGSLEPDQIRTLGEEYVRVYKIMNATMAEWERLHQP